MENKTSNLSSELTEEQTSFLNENYNKLNEKELYQKLSEIGPKPDMNAFGDLLASKIETDVFEQEVSESELGTVAGGLCGFNGYECEKPQANYEKSHCTDENRRNIYEGEFPNCAATVEDGSWCGSNDACFKGSVDYQGMTDCKKAWK